jgi:hypothetical protein
VEGAQCDSSHGRVQGELGPEDGDRLHRRAPTNAMASWRPNSIVALYHGELETMERSSGIHQGRRRAPAGRSHGGEVRPWSGASAWR